MNLVEPFQAFPSTWELILQHCPENEVEEVKIMLGTSLIEQTIDLHNEVSSKQLPLICHNFPVSHAIMLVI